MCDWCIVHGAGEKWYLQAKSYSLDMLDDPDRHLYMNEHFLRLEEKLGTVIPTVDWVMNHAPVVNRLFRRLLNGWINTWHGGQVIPVEDAKAVLRLADEHGGIARYSCICRRMLGGIRHEPMCLFFGVHFPWKAPLLNYVDFTPEFEPLSLQEAESFLDENYKHGLVNNLATLKTPFLMGICSCEYPTCIFMRLRRDWGIEKISQKSEYIICHDAGLCKDCGKCLERCQFKSLTYAPEIKKVTVDYGECFGCGVCRAVCPSGALRLLNRAESGKYRYSF